MKYIKNFLIIFTILPVFGLHSSELKRKTIFSNIIAHNQDKNLKIKLDVYEIFHSPIITTQEGSITLLLQDATICILNYFLIDKKSYCISLLKTETSMRNQGYAKNILEFSIKLFTHLGVKEISLMVSPQDRTTKKERLISFYSKHGFILENNDIMTLIVPPTSSL